MDHLATVCTVRILLTATVAELHQLQNGLQLIKTSLHPSITEDRLEDLHSFDFIEVLT